MSRPVRRTPVNHTAAARRLRAHPGRWMPVGIYRARTTADATSWAIRSGRGAYGPKGAYQARLAIAGDETRVEARYMADRITDGVQKRGRWVPAPKRDRDRILGQIARGEVRADADAARAIASRHEAAYGDVWSRPAVPGSDAAWAGAVASLRDGASE